MVVGKGLESGVVEFRNRKSGEKSELPLATALTTIISTIQEA